MSVVERSSLFRSNTIVTRKHPQDCSFCENNGCFYKSCHTGPAIACIEIAGQCVAIIGRIIAAATFLHVALFSSYSKTMLWNGVITEPRNRHRVKFIVIDETGNTLGGQMWKSANLTKHLAFWRIYKCQFSIPLASLWHCLSMENVANCNIIKYQYACERWSLIWKKMEILSSVDLDTGWFYV